MGTDAYLKAVETTLAALPREPLEKLVSILEQARKLGKQVFLIGNGGSAANASHIACDLGKGTICPDKKRFRVTALTDNVPLMTAWANDTSYEMVFVEQLSGLLRPGDVLIALSGSGNSPNILHAVDYASAAGAITVGLTGYDGGRLAGMVDHAVVVSDNCMERIEDVHLILGHAVAVALREIIAREAVAPRDRVVFLDRDGVINELAPNNGYVTRWEEFHFLPSALVGIRRLTENGYRVVIVSNQSCIGRGLATHEDIRQIHSIMEEKIKESGGNVEAIYYCPHRPGDGCSCRKPKPGMFLAAMGDLGIDLVQSVFVGDSVTDLLAADKIHATSILVRTGYGSEAEQELGPEVVEPAFVADDLSDAVDWILAQGKR
jgi:D-sedoheptulose 7-phosphate isomerase